MSDFSMSDFSMFVCHSRKCFADIFLIETLKVKVHWLFHRCGRLQFALCIYTRTPLLSQAYFHRGPNFNCIETAIARLKFGVLLTLQNEKKGMITTYTANRIRKELMPATMHCVFLATLQSTAHASQEARLFRISHACTHLLMLYERCCLARHIRTFLCLNA